MTKRSEFDLGFAPRGLSREEAACYIGVSASTFDQMVAAGRMPHPKIIGRRRVWDRHAVDSAFCALPGGEDAPADTNPWPG